jgi:hypothetical protein
VKQLLISDPETHLNSAQYLTQLKAFASPDLIWNMELNLVGIQQLMKSDWLLIEQVRTVKPSMAFFSFMDMELSLIKSWQYIISNLQQIKEMLPVRPIMFFVSTIEKVLELI